MSALRITYYEENRRIGNFAALKRERPDLFQTALARFEDVAAALRRLGDDLAAADPDLILFSDSTSIRCAQGENPCVSLDEHLARALSRRVVSVQNNAYSFLLYNELFTLLPPARRPVPALMTVNMRVFSEEWFLRPSYLFPDIRAVIRYLAGELSFSAALEQYFLCTATDFMREETRTFKSRASAMYPNENKTIGYILEGRHRDVRLSLEFFYCYPPAWAESNVAALLRPLQTLSGKGYLPCAYLTPVNYEAILEFCGHEARAEYAATVRLLARALQKECAAFADCSSLLGVGAFMDLAEHLYAPAKKALANKLAESLSPLLPPPAPGKTPEAAPLDVSLLKVILPAEMEAAAQCIQAKRE